MGKEMMVIRTAQRKNGNRKELTEEEERFLDLVIEGVSRTEAIFISGVYPPDGRDDPEERKRADGKARRIIQSQRAKLYIKNHRKVARVFVPGDMEELATHMFDIAMGIATKKTRKWDGEEGCYVEDVETPNFKDQTGAADWLLKYVKVLKEEQRCGTVIPIEQKMKALDVKATEFIEKFDGREVDDGFQVDRYGKDKAFRRYADSMIGEGDDEVDGDM